MPAGTTGTTGPVGAHRLAISRPVFSAKRTRRVGSLQVRLRLVGGGSLSGVSVKIVDAQGRVLFSTSTATRNLRLLPRVPLTSLEVGAVKVVVSATDGGEPLTVTQASSVKR